MTVGFGFAKTIEEMWFVKARKHGCGCGCLHLSRGKNMRPAREQNISINGYSGQDMPARVSYIKLQTGENGSISYRIEYTPRGIRVWTVN